MSQLLKSCRPDRQGRRGIVTGMPRRDVGPPSNQLPGPPPQVPGQTPSRATQARLLELMSAVTVLAAGKNEAGGVRFSGAC